MNNLRKVYVNQCAWMGAMVSTFLLCAWMLSVGEAKETVLAISGTVKQRVELKLADLQKMERVSAKASDRDGKERQFEGVRLWDVIQKTLSFDAKEHKELVNTCVVVKARDGYQAVFALAELAPSVGDKAVILADQCDGKSLPEGDGILRIVVPGEKMRSRWVRQVEKLEIISLLPRTGGK